MNAITKLITWLIIGGFGLLILGIIAKTVMNQYNEIKKVYGRE